jgi:hypothetical protein
VLPTLPLLVQPNNTGSPTDDFARHREAARKEVEANLGRRVADRLRAPLIVPVFPRPNEEPVDFTHLVHSLDRETLAIEDGPLERVDRQLLAMAEDARERLRDAEYPIGDGLLLNGFSASGTFVERFASLHPEEVVSVTAGGVNGMPLLPLAEADGHDLDYHVGVADVEALTGEPFDRDAFAEVNRFLYMGEFDDSDTLPFDDAFTLNRLRTAALDVYGPHMTDDRFPYSRAVYDELGANTVFRTYRGEAHTYRPAINDIVRYHARTIAGDDTAALRASLGGQTPNRRAQIVARPHRPIAGERVAFNASDSIAAGQQPTAYEWTFEDGTTATGKTTARTFGEPGTYAVTLRTTYPDATYEATDYVTVTSPPSGAEPAVGETTTAPADTATDRPDRTASARSTDASGPGFGVGVTATALFGAAELLRRLGDTDSDQ